MIQSSSSQPCGLITTLLRNGWRTPGPTRQRPPICPPVVAPRMHLHAAPPPELAQAVSRLTWHVSLANAQQHAYTVAKVAWTPGWASLLVLHACWFEATCHQSRHCIRLRSTTANGTQDASAAACALRAAWTASSSRAKVRQQLATAGCALPGRSGARKLPDPTHCGALLASKHP